MIQALHSFIYIHLSHIYPLISVCQGPCCICYLVSPAFSVICLLLSAVTSLTVMVILYFDYFLFYFKDQDDHVSYFGFTSCFCFFLPFTCTEHVFYAFVLLLWIPFVCKSLTLWSFWFFPQPWKNFAFCSFCCFIILHLAPLSRFPFNTTVKVQGWLIFF